MVSEVWTCRNGHPVCGECIDIDNVEPDHMTDTTKTAHTDTSSVTSDINTVSGTFTGLEVSSYVR